MKPAETLRRLRRIRREARAILAAHPAPALAQTMHTVDRACHLAAWQIGDAARLLPEEDNVRGAARSVRRAAPQPRRVGHGPRAR